MLIEAVAALAIIGLAAIALLATTSQQLRTAAQAKELIVQKSLADDRLSAIRLLDYEGISDPPDSLLQGAFEAPFEEYEWVAVIEAIEDEYDLFGVEIVVEGPQETYPLRTLLHRPRPVFAAPAGEGVPLPPPPSSVGGSGGRGGGGRGGGGAP